MLESVVGLAGLFMQAYADYRAMLSLEINGVLFRFLWTLERNEYLLFGITARSLASIGD